MNIDMMPWRLQNLQAAIDAFRASGVPLVTLTNGVWGRADLSDDPGLFLIAAPIGAYLNLNATQTATLLLGLLLALGTLVGSLGIWRAFRTTESRVVGVAAALLLAAVTFEIGDVYSVSAAVLIGGVPWLLAVMRHPRTRTLLALGILAGLGAGLANIMRAHAGTTMALIAVSGLALTRTVAPRFRVLACLLLVLAMSAAPVWVAAARATRDDYLAKVGDEAATTSVGHPFWHTVYIGLGYVPNTHGIAYRDEIAIDFVRAKAPQAPLFGTEYESILRQEVMRLIRKDPVFVARSVGAKLLALIGYFLAFANIGALAFVRAPVPAHEAVALLLGLSFSTLPGFLAIPLPNYLTGFIAMSTLLGIVGIDSWFAKRAAQTAVPAES